MPEGILDQRCNQHMFSFLQLFFEDTIDDAKYCGRLYGLGTGVAQKQNEDVETAQEKMSILAIINNMQQWHLGAIQYEMGPWRLATSLNALQPHDRKTGVFFAEGKRHLYFES